MSIQTELTRITNAKAAIKTAVEGKGVTVPDGTLLDGMAALIEAIETGGGSATIYSGEITMAQDAASFGIEIDKPDGVENYSVPKFAFAYNKTYTTVVEENRQTYCRALALAAQKDGIGIRYSQNPEETGGGVHEDPSEVCRWYGVKTWFFGSNDENYRAMRAGDTYGYFFFF